MSDKCDGLNGIMCEDCGGAEEASRQCNREIKCEKPVNSQNKRTRLDAKTLTQDKAYHDTY